MASWNPKNERWGIFHYIKMPKHSFFWKNQGQHYFSRFTNWPLVDDNLGKTASQLPDALNEKRQKQDYFLGSNFSLKLQNFQTHYLYHLVSHGNVSLTLGQKESFLFSSTTDYGHPMKAQIKEIWNFGPMRQTKYALAVPKNLGLGFDFWPCSEGHFLNGRL